MCAARFAVISFLLSSGAPCEAALRAKICGVVEDQTSAAIPGIVVKLTSTESSKTTSTDAGGQFCLPDLEPGGYQLELRGPNFRVEQRRLELRSGESLQLTIKLTIQTAGMEVTVVEGAGDPGSLNVAQTQFSKGLIEKLPSESVNAAMSSILTLTTPGVAADSNGVFHPLGEHAETSFSVDGQPISDQQSRIFSNQISVNAIQEIRTIQGAPPAEYGDKTSLIVETTTRTGLNAGKSTGSASLGYGSFETPTASITLASGNRTIGNFVAIDGIDSDRFLDSPEFVPLHARGNAENIFDRFDWRLSEATSLHLNLS